MKTHRPRRWCACSVFLAALAVSGCTAPAPPAAPAPAPAPQPSGPPAATAPKLPEAHTEADWRRAVAQHILAANAENVFEGRPPHPLKGIVVLDLTVGVDGRIQRASVLRAPEHARELGAEAVRSAQAASPLPPPPRALLARGSVRFTETWLYRQDNRFQLRTLAQTQLIQ